MKFTALVVTFNIAEIIEKLVTMYLVLYRAPARTA